MNHLKHSVDILQHFVIPKADDAITLRLEKFRPPRIPFSLFRVLTAVDLDHDLESVVRKINDVVTESNLSAKMGCWYWQPMTQMPPKLSFGFGCIKPHRASAHFIW